MIKLDCFVRIKQDMSIAFTPRQVSLTKWVGFTSLGWVAGIPLLMTLAGLLEPINLGRTAIALGMGTGIAFFQWLVLRKTSSEAGAWWWISPLTFATPFLFADGLGKGFFPSDESAIVFSTLVGAVLLGWAQQRWVLKARGVSLPMWLGATVMAYSLALIPPFLLTVTRIKDLNLPDSVSITLSFLTVLAGGPIIGWLTGMTLVKHLN